MNSNENFGKNKINFDFYLSQANNIKPKEMDRLNIKNLLKNGQFDDVNKIIEDYSQENFEQNGK